MSEDSSSSGAEAANPPGSFNAHWFAIFNAVSFQIVMGAPIILYAKTLGASSTQLGIVAALGPLMMVMQLPSARFLGRYSYREFMLMGWSARTVLVFVIATIPLMHFIGDDTKLLLIIAGLFFFNLLRGIATTAGGPWMTAMIPEHGRGRFFAIDHMFGIVGALVALLVSAYIMQSKPGSVGYSLVFFISAITATCSLFFIKRMPDIHAKETLRKCATVVPWREMLRYAPFFRLLVFNLCFLVVTAGMGVFSLDFLRTKMGFDSAQVLWSGVFGIVGALAILPLCAPVIDRVGSKPIIRFSVAIFVVMVFGWFLLAAGVAPQSFTFVSSLNAIAGIAGAAYTLAMVRITMGTLPEMGRNHFSALNTVFTSLVAAAVPIFWGVMLDSLGTFERVTGGVTWMRFSIYFLIVTLLAIGVFFAVSILVESHRKKEGEALDVYRKGKGQ